MRRYLGGLFLLLFACGGAEMLDDPTDSAAEVSATASSLLPTVVETSVASTVVATTVQPVVPQSGCFASPGFGAEYDAELDRLADQLVHQHTDERGRIPDHGIVYQQLISGVAEEDIVYPEMMELALTIDALPWDVTIVFRDDVAGVQLGWVGATRTELATWIVEVARPAPGNPMSIYYLDPAFAGDCRGEALEPTIVIPPSDLAFIRLVVGEARIAPWSGAG